MCVNSRSQDDVSDAKLDFSKGKKEADLPGFKQHNGLMLCFSGTGFINKRFQLSQERNNCTISIYGIIHSSQGICFFLTIAVLLILSQCTLAGN